jgi:hypothetical protein
LANDEIDRKGGITALRNIFLSDDKKAFIKIDFTNNGYGATKSIYYQNKALMTELAHLSKDFEKYFSAVYEEKFILRYKDLLRFVLSSKTEKLKELSNIIGFSIVTDIRDTLRKSLSDLKKEIKIKDYETQINVQRRNIIDNIKVNIATDAQLIEAVNGMVKVLGIDTRANAYEDIDKIVELLKKPGDIKKLELQSFYNKIITLFENNKGKREELERQYNEYINKFKGITGSIEKINQLMMEVLLSEGVKVLNNSNNYATECPLCLQSIKKEVLIKKLELRISELEAIKAEKSQLSELNQTLKKTIDPILQGISGLLMDENLNHKDNLVLKKDIEEIKQKYIQLSRELSIEPVAGVVINEWNKVGVKDDDTGVIGFCNLQVNILKDSEKSNSTEVLLRIDSAKKAYAEIKRLDKEKALIEGQRDTIEILYSAFLKKQKESIESFLLTFSNDINEIYQFMNPGEKVENIRLEPISNTDDELMGITFQFKYYDAEVKPINKYLSEAHLNCLGIAFFLASVKAFNKGKYLILDDVISSYDSNHRKRFADLLVEKYSDYQIVLLTHEKNWFDMVRKLVKNKNWEIRVIKWDENQGTHIEESIDDIKVRIENKIASGDLVGFANDERQYLEHLLKDIAFNIGVRVQFRFNENNEDRMANELLSELKGHINKQKCKELKEKNIIDRIMGSIVLNKGSHDTKLDIKMGDCKALWEDIKELEALFVCPGKCGGYISMRYYDDVNKQIRCGCGQKYYSWKN